MRIGRKTWRSGQWVVVSLGLAVLGCTAVQAQSVPTERPNRGYEEVFTFKNRQAYTEDPHLWVYTKEFAERFQMPAQWVDEDLKGALAIAFRIERGGARTCGLFGKEDACAEAKRCVLEVYFDSKAPLPWTRPDIVADSRHGDRGMHYLRPRFGTYATGIRYNLAFGLPDGAALVDYPPRVMGGGRGLLMYFDREFYPGTAVLGYSSCPGVAPVTSVSMRFLTKEAVTLRAQKRSFDHLPLALEVQVPMRFYDATFKLNESADRADWEKVFEDLRRRR